MAVEMSLGFGLGLRSRIALIRPRVAGAASILGRTGLGILPFATLANAASDGVGAGGDDGAVVVGVGVRCARDGGEKRVRRVAVPAGGFAHRAGMFPPRTDRPDAGVSVLVVT